MAGQEDLHHLGKQKTEIKQMNWTSSIASERTKTMQNKNEDETQTNILWLFASNVLRRISYWMFWTIQDHQVQKLSLHNKALKLLRYRILCEIILSWLGIDNQLWLGLTFKSSLLQTFAKHDHRYSACSCDTFQETEQKQQKPNISWKLSAFPVSGTGKESTSLTDRLVKALHSRIA